MQRWANGTSLMRVDARALAALMGLGCAPSLHVCPAPCHSISLCFTYTN